jgi:serine/threonine protein kinase
VAILRTTTAARLFGDADPIGQEIVLRGKSRRRVVAVVGDAQLFALNGETPLQIYMPFTQANELYYNPAPPADGSSTHVLAPGTRIGHYDVQAFIGRGGMGEVYRALDTRLKREVAVKILPTTFAADGERLARFEREAQLLASLNHPHIAGVYGIEESNDTRAIVMELVEGPTLADRIAHGPIPVDETLAIARQIAEALEAAHAAGIIHRDLKPANVKLRPDGTVKVLDFGLAKGAAAGASSLAAPSAVLDSPTIASPVMTMQGVILGTAAYMSPEQAKGKSVDKRADLWAFGVVVYEMLTGNRAYEGDDVSETLASVIKTDPDWRRLPADTPATIRRLLSRCLAKDPRLRLHDAGDALLDIRDALSGTDEQPAAPVSSRRDSVRGRVLAVAALIAAVAAGAATMWLLQRQTRGGPGPVRRSTIVIPESESLPLARGRLLAVSPDGQTVVYRTSPEPTGKLFRRSLHQFEAAPIPNTDGGSEPFFSPDGQWLGFQAGLELRKVPISGGPAQVIVAMDIPTRGAVWTSDGRIIFSTNEPNGRLMQVSASGGEATLLFRLSDPLRMWYPQLLPTENAVLFTASEGAPDTGEVRLVRLDTGEERTIVRHAAAGRVLPTGHLVFIREAALWAVPIDPTRFEVIGEPVPVVPDVRTELGGAVQFAIGNEGSLLYVPSIVTADQRSLLLVGRDGQTERPPLPARAYVSLAWSPDWTRVAVQVGEGENADVWVGELSRGTLTRVTDEIGYDGHPAWSPDSRHIVFGASRKNRWSLHRRLADGTGETELLIRFDDSVSSVRPHAWSADGAMLVCDIRQGESVDIGVLTMGDRKWRTLLASASNEAHPAISPDGRWIAYHSSEAGQPEVSVQRFPALGDRQVVSVGNGHTAKWTADGRSLMYLRGSPPTAVMRTTYQAAQNGSLAFSPPEVVGNYSFYARQGYGRIYDVSRDGTRLLLMGAGSPAAGNQRHINVVTNWFEELKALVPIP